MPPILPLPWISPPSFCPAGPLHFPRRIKTQQFQGDIIMKGDTKPDPDPNKRMVDEKEHFLRLAVSEDTIDILRYLNEHGTGQYKDFMEFVNVDTLHDRIDQLLEFDLITHHSEEEPGIKQYELKDKGRKVLQIMNDIINLAM